MLVDEGDHYLGRRSSSAWAKNADALRRISFARFSSTILALQLLQSLPLVRRQAGSMAGITLRLAHPSAQRLTRAAQLLGRPTESPPTATDAPARARRPSGLRVLVSRESILLGRAMGSILSLNGPSDKPGTVQALVFTAPANKPLPNASGHLDHRCGALTSLPANTTGPPLTSTWPRLPGDQNRSLRR